MAAGSTSARKRRAGAQPRRAPAPRPVSDSIPTPAAPRAWRTAALIGSALLALYVLNFRLLSVGDTLPTRVLPFSILREGDLDLDEFSWTRRSDGRLPYYIHWHGEHLYSVSPLGTALAITPLYVLPAWWLAANDVSYDDVRARVVIVVMERVAAATLTALSAAILFVVLTRLTTVGWAAALTLFYGIGTSAWSISSQALWPHALSELCLVTLTAIVLRPAPSRAALALAGLVVALMGVNRPQMGIFGLLALAFIWRHHRRHVLAFVAVPVLGAVLLVWYNRAIFNYAAGGYGGPDHFDGSLVDGFFGLLISPNRGLLVYTPLMVFALWGAVRVWRVPVPPWLRWLGIGLLLHVLMYAKFKEWWAGYAYGPRYFADVLPVLTVFLVYGLVPYWRVAAVRVAAAVLAGYCVAIQALGVYAADDRWNRDPAPLESRPERVWDLADLQIVRAARNGWRGGELAGAMIDAFRDPIPVLVAPLAPTDLASTIAARDLPAEVARKGIATGVVEITNRGSKGWPAFSGEGVIGRQHLIFLLARWFSNGQPLAGEGDVVPLPVNVAPGERIEMPVAIPAPAVAGSLELELRVTQAVDRIHGTAGPDAARIPIRVR